MTLLNKEANHLIAVTRNQGNLQKQVQDSLRFRPSFSEDTDYGHGQIETRRRFFISNLFLIENSFEPLDTFTLV